MAHHKRRRPKSRRAGCLWCKPHKHQRGKNGFAAQTVQEQRELLMESGAVPGRRSKKRNTRRWCRGKAGRLHTPTWQDHGHWFTVRDVRRWSSRWKLICTACGKRLGYVSYFGSRKVVVSKFPGSEAFHDFEPPDPPDGRGGVAHGPVWLGQVDAG